MNIFSEHWTIVDGRWETEESGAYVFVEDGLIGIEMGSDRWSSDDARSISLRLVEAATLADIQLVQEGPDDEVEPEVEPEPEAQAEAPAATINESSESEPESEWVWDPEHEQWRMRLS